MTGQQGQGGVQDRGLGGGEEVWFWQVLGEPKEQGGRPGGREGDEDVLSSSSWSEGTRL